MFKSGQQIYNPYKGLRVDVEFCMDFWLICLCEKILALYEPDSKYKAV